VGVGNIGSLGYSSFKLTQGKVTMEILLDLRVFIWLTIGVVVPMYCSIWCGSAK